MSKKKTKGSHNVPKRNIYTEGNIIQENQMCSVIV